MSEVPLVSVCVVTYQHKDFIRNCLDGILMQQTNFPFEIILGEDESTDGTREICQAYAEKYPDKIRLFLRSRKDVIYINQHATGRFNFIENLKSARGKYIALCEGDDYWTDDNKLQKQVDFLEAYPNYSLCFHNYILKNEKKRSEKVKFSAGETEKSVFVTEDILGAWFIATASVVFRRDYLVLPEWLSVVESGDVALLLLLSLKGSFKYLHDVMSVYRVHDSGISQRHIGYSKVLSMVYLYQTFNIHTNYAYNERVIEALKFELHYHIISDEVKKRVEKAVDSNKNKLLKKVLSRLGLKQFTRLKKSFDVKK